MNGSGNGLGQHFVAAGVGVQTIFAQTTQPAHIQPSAAGNLSNDVVTAKAIRMMDSQRRHLLLTGMALVIAAAYALG